VLAALLSIWLFGGGSASSTTVGYVDQVIAYARNEIADEEQRSAVLATAKKLEMAGRTEVKATANATSAVARIAGNREATLQEYQSGFSQIRRSSLELQEELIRRRFELKAELTRQQWSALHADRESRVAGH
jgi:hypothetical protein